MRMALAFFISAAVAASFAPAHATDFERELKANVRASTFEAEGAVVRGDSDRYVFEARKGMTASLKVTSIEDNASFQIYLPGSKTASQTADGENLRTLPRAGAEDSAKSWSGKLPATGRYAIVVGPTRGNATYKLTVKLR
ncbi:hypothetical protein [Terrarubrum flagellatum]|uniref:hypothetical protein n=1 Tax=Terrirubrum flagellatum TaxID=2895980 RepID=UPI003144DAAD